METVWAGDASGNTSVLFTRRAFVSLGMGAALATSLLPVPNLLAADNELVEYRLNKWKAAHFHNAKDADKVLDTLKRLGCEARKEAHGDHQDIVYRCPEWRMYKAKTHDEAHQWEKWLQAYGFETKHTH